jgi:hypothetical protein
MMVRTECAAKTGPVRILPNIKVQTHLLDLCQQQAKAASRNRSTPTQVEQERSIASKQ